MIGEDYKPTSFLKFVWDKAKRSIVFTLVALSMTIGAFVMTPDMTKDNPTWLVITLDLILLSSTIANVLHPYSIWRKLKKNNEK